MTTKSGPAMYPDFVDIVRALETAEAEFVIVGAHALAAHGVPRATADLDVFVGATPTNAAKVHAALVAFGAPLAAHGMRVEDLATPGTVYQIGLPPRRIDLLTSISGVSFEEACASVVVVDLEGLRVPVLGKEALLKNKRASGRPKDLLDVAAIEKHDAG